MFGKFRYAATSGLAHVLALFALCLLGLVSGADAQVTGFKQAVAEATAGDEDLSAFYRDTGFEPIWTGNSDQDRRRRAALIRALEDAGLHGLPVARYGLADLTDRMKAVRSSRDLGFLEVEISRAFLKYAREVQSGTLKPRAIDDGLVRKVQYRDRADLLRGIAGTEPEAFVRSLPPQTGEYRALMKQKLLLERLIARGGWGERVPGGALKPGQSGAGVVALRDRLTRMGYLSRSAAASYDKPLSAAVEAFQRAHGLEPDGVAGEGTLREINVSADRRLQSVLVAMERERWLNRDRGTRHVLVNLADFTAKIIQNGEVKFQTRSVVGKNVSDRRSPEFSDVMERMVINPSWYVPRSIITKEYLPKLRRNPNAVSHLVITDRRGRKVNRGSVNFSQFTARNFPFAMSQPPGSRNALGRVKFLFPNKYNIYLHDTPQKSLFSHEVRAYSHGCIRLAEPFDFAYAVLEPQSDDPVGEFQRILKSGRETPVELTDPLPVHLIYRTAFTTHDNRLEFRRDVYGRDAKIWAALSAAGVALPSIQG